LPMPSFASIRSPSRQFAGSSSTNTTRLEDTSSLSVTRGAAAPPAPLRSGSTGAPPDTAPDTAPVAVAGTAAACTPATDTPHQAQLRQAPTPQAHNHVAPGNGMQHTVEGGDTGEAPWAPTPSRLMWTAKSDTAPPVHRSTAPVTKPVTHDHSHETTHYTSQPPPQPKHRPHNTLAHSHIRSPHTPYPTPTPTHACTTQPATPGCTMSQAHTQARTLHTEPLAKHHRLYSSVTYPATAPALLTLLCHRPSHAAGAPASQARGEEPAAPSDRPRGPGSQTPVPGVQRLPTQREPSVPQDQPRYHRPRGLPLGPPRD
jgi:hypothetical protein